ncbi:class I SAM-dependent methyltransferase [Usitatibacter palustris]|nr:class I SAM-dependent methyltransferase [Usitatibacter palustris]
MRLQLTTLHADPVDIGVDNGVRIWNVHSNDPAFLASVTEGELGLDVGWYAASARIDGRSGDVRDPRLYLPDSIGAYSETYAVDMVRDGAVFKAEFFLPHPSRHVRFDPSTMPCEFACDTLELTSISGPSYQEVPASELHEPGTASLMSRAHVAMRRFFSSPAAVPGLARPLGRKARVLEGIDKAGTGLEIGPSHDPLAPKREGYNVHIIDHATREDLVAKYQGQGLPLEQIEEVDFVWSGQTYLELTGKPKHYDWIIASHLIEHTPDIIAFLADCDSLLKDGGVLSLVIPDKRYVFDRFRPITGLARVIDSHLAGMKVHSAGTAAEYYMNVAAKSGLLGWDAATPGDYRFIHSAQQARDKIREVRDKGAYLDVHNWCFVPHSFRLLMADLFALGYTKLREVRFHATEGCEFYVTLARHGTGPHMSRLEILRAIDAELASSEPR